jgi:hypothetical protein
VTSAPLPSAPYLEQCARWPGAGRHILAQFTDNSLIVYQAYRPSIGRFAIDHGVFGGPDFSFSRMSWIKPNFAWMMYRSGWGTKEGQEVTLALRIRRAFFERLLLEAVPSAHWPELHATRAEWQSALASSEVRLQWDPDHDPAGNPLARRAVQLGVRGQALRELATTELLEVIDMSAFVAEQRTNKSLSERDALLTPIESVYPVPAAAAARVALDIAPFED